MRSPSAQAWAQAVRVLTDNSNKRDLQSAGAALDAIATLVKRGDFKGVPQVSSCVVTIARRSMGHTGKDVRLKAMTVLTLIMDKCWGDACTTKAMRASTTECLLSIVDECAAQATGLKNHAERDTYQLAIFSLARRQMTLLSHESARLLDQLVAIRKVAASVSIRRECSMALMRLAKVHGAVGRDWVTWLPPIIDELLHASVDAKELAKFQKHLPEVFANCWDLRAVPINVAEVVANHLEDMRDVSMAMPLLALLVECLGQHAYVLFTKSGARQTLLAAFVSDNETCAAAWALWRCVLLQATSWPPLLAAPFTLALDLRTPEHVWPLAMHTLSDFWLSLTTIDNVLFSNFQDVLLQLIQRKETAMDARALVHHCCVAQLAPDHLETFQGFWLKLVCVLCRQAAGGQTAKVGVIMEWLVSKTQVLAAWLRKPGPNQGQYGLHGLSVMLSDAEERGCLGSDCVRLFDSVVHLVQLMLKRLPRTSLPSVLLRMAHCRLAAPVPDVELDNRIVAFAHTVLAEARADSEPLLVLVEAMLFDEDEKMWFDLSEYHIVLRVRLFMVASEFCVIKPSPLPSKLLAFGLVVMFRLLHRSTKIAHANMAQRIDLCAQFFARWSDLYGLYAKVHTEASTLTASACQGPVSLMAMQLHQKSDTLLPLYATVVNGLIEKVLAPILSTIRAAEASSLSATSNLSDGESADEEPALNALHWQCAMAVKVFTVSQIVERGVNTVALFNAVRVHLIDKVRGWSDAHALLTRGHSGKAQSEAAAVEILDNVECVLADVCCEGTNSNGNDLVVAAIHMVARCNVVPVHECVLSWLLVAMQSQLKEVKTAALRLWNGHVVAKLQDTSALSDDQRNAIQ